MQLTNVREYETLFILKPDSTDESMQSVRERLLSVIDRQGGRLLRYNIWGKRKLAFEVAKNPKGIYIQLRFLSQPTAVRELERNLRVLEPVIRYQTIKMGENVDVDKRMAEQEAEDRARAATEAEARARAEAQGQALEPAVGIPEVEDEEPPRHHHRFGDEADADMSPGVDEEE